METFLVDSPLIKADDEMALESDLIIRHAAERYLEAIKKADELKVGAEDRLFSGTPGSIYLKRLGHRALTKEEKETIVSAKGTEEDKRAMVDFSLAQENLSQRLKPIGQFVRLVLDQAELAKANYYARMNRPDLWTPDEMIRVVDVLTRLQI
jgi:hypothetical protein